MGVELSWRSKERRVVSWREFEIEIKIDDVIETGAALHSTPCLGL